MSALDEHLKRHRQKIIDREEKTFREMLAAYSEIEKELKKSFDELQQKIEETRASGDDISPSWFFRESRLKKLLAQVEEQIGRFGGTATRIIEREQRAAIEIAIRHAQETFDFQISQADRDDSTRNFAGQMNPRNVETAVGMMGDGSPLREYFEQQLAPMVAERIKSEVIKASALGTDFKTISKRLQEAGGITKYRALSVARTEVNRVRRETTRQIYQDNSDIIENWEWVASKSSRTCPLCLAMDGRIFPLDEPFPQHINCRCSLLAVIKGIKRKSRTIGQQWFLEQPKETQEQILGRNYFEIWKRTKFNLIKLVGFREHKNFGKSVYKKNLGELNIKKRLV